jgi:hypothetical protein
MEAEKQAANIETRKVTKGEPQPERKKIRAYKHKLKKFHEDSVLSLYSTQGA